MVSPLKSIVTLTVLLLSFALLATCNALIAPTSQLMATPKGPRRELPSKLLIGYATDCNEAAITRAVREGINVIIWSFLEIHANEPLQVNSLDLERIRQLIRQLDQEGYNDTLHLVSFGGWNGPHLDTKLSAEDWYNVWKTSVGDIFHGIDWDLEGHDRLDSPTNEFRLDCLDKMGRISQLAKRDGYTIGMAPPQSYLDISSPQFSRLVNRTEAQRPWHAEFHYFGANVYAYLLAKYSDSIDFVSIQFYESYSRAAMAIYHEGMTPQDYLLSYIEQLVDQNESFWVQFQDDPSVQLVNQRVALPLSKLVLGFANGWALDTKEKAAYFPPGSVQETYRHLELGGQAPRGFMFWVLGEEGKHGVHYTRALNEILHIRDSAPDREDL